MNVLQYGAIIILASWVIIGLLMFKTNVFKFDD